MARRVPKPTLEAKSDDSAVAADLEHSDLTTTVSSGDDTNPESSRIPGMFDRDHVFKYIPRDDYYHLESCAKRIWGKDEEREETLDEEMKAKLNEKREKTLDEFLFYFFNNTVLDLRAERPAIPWYHNAEESSSWPRRHSVVSNFP